MSDIITLHNRVIINRKTGEITKLEPVELTIEQFHDWIQPAIPFLTNMVLEVRKLQREGGQQ